MLEKLGLTLMLLVMQIMIISPERIDRSLAQVLFIGGCVLFVGPVREVSK